MTLRATGSLVGMPIRALLRILAIVALVAACNNTPSAAPPAASGSTGAGTTAPLASGGGPEATDAPVEPSVPSSKARIRRAQADGRLDADTAMLYRIYALFGAPELPAEYRSDVWAEDNAALDLATSRLERLPAAIADAVRPFVVRPTDPTSVFFGSPATASAQLASTRTSSLTAAVTCGANGWASLDGTSHFKVWGRCGAGFDVADLELVAGILDALWTDESTYMGRQPITDAGGPSEGGDDRIDIYLIANCISRGGTCVSHGGLAAAMAAPPFSGSSGSQRTSGFMLINRATLGWPETPATVAHEMFHLLQYAFNQGVMWAGGDEYWFVEASAAWAEYRFVGAPTFDPGRYADYQASDLSLQENVDDNIYRSFVWPLFMEEEAGDGTIAATWAAVQGVATRDRFTDAIDAKLPFKDHFRDFAVRDWNDDEAAGVIGPMLPIDAVGTPRVMPKLGRRGTSATLQANPAGTAPREFNVGIDSLAPWFQYFAVDNAVGQVTLSFGGVQPRAAFDVDLLVYVPGIGWDRRQVVDNRIQLCRNLPADKVTEIVVVLSNHDKDPAAHVSGTWTAASLQEPCPVGMTGDVTARLVDMYVDPEGGQHPITGTLQLHLVVEIGPYGSLYVARGSTYSYELHYAPMFACGSGVVMDSGGLAPRKNQGPYDNADPNAMGTATIGGGGEGPGAELGLDISIPPPAAACQGGWNQTFGFVRNQQGIYIHDYPRTRFDKFNGYREDESHGEIVDGR